MSDSTGFTVPASVYEAINDPWDDDDEFSRIIIVEPDDESSVLFSVSRNGVLEVWTCTAEGQRRGVFAFTEEGATLLKSYLEGLVE